MNNYKRVFVPAVMFFVVVLAPVSGFAAPCIPCEQLAAVDFGSDVTITSATRIPFNKRGTQDAKSSDS